MSEDPLELLIMKKKEELKKLVDEKNSIKSEEVHQKSKELDQLVVKLMKKKKKC